MTDTAWYITYLMGAWAIIASFAAMLYRHKWQVERQKQEAVYIEVGYLIHAGDKFLPFVCPASEYVTLSKLPEGTPVYIKLENKNE